MKTNIKIRAVLIASVACSSAAFSQQGMGDWPQHSRERPLPTVVTPGAPALPVPPPADAIVLFDGTSLARWEDGKGGPAKWKLIAGGAMEVAPGTGGIQTREKFGDAQVHVEWMSPNPPRGKDEDRDNSGVFLMVMFEVQLLDSYDSPTSADGQAAAIYGEYPPL